MSSDPALDALLDNFSVQKPAPQSVDAANHAPSTPIAHENPSAGDEILENFTTEKPGQGSPATSKSFTPPTTAYENMPWGDVAASAIEHVPGEVASGLSAVAHGVSSAVNDPSGAASAVVNAGKNLWQGARATYLRNTDGGEDGANPHNLSEDDIAKSDALMHGLHETYGTLFEPGGFKRAIATKPISTMMDVSAPFTLAGSALKKGPGLVGTAGRALEATGSALDPAQQALQIAKLPMQALKPVVPFIQRVTTGSPYGALKAAAEAGESSNPVLRDAFRAHLNGSAPPSEITSAIRGAAQQLQADRSAAYIQGAKDVGIRGAQPGTLPTLSYAPIDNALDDARGMTRQFDPATGTQRIIYGDADKVLDAIEAEIRARQSAPVSVPGPNGQLVPSIYHNLEGFDGLKKFIGQFQSGQGVSALQNAAVTKLYNSVLDAIHGPANAPIHPDYAKVMEKYATASKQLSEISSTFGTGARVNDSAALAKILKEYKKNGGGDLLAELTKKDPTIPFRLAGHTLSEFIPGGIRGALNFTSGVGTGMVNPLYPVAQVAASSPRLMGNLNYIAGRFIGAKPPPIATQGAYRAGEAVSGLQPPDNRMERKSGGNVSNDAAHDHLVARLMNLAEKAKRGENATTKPLLNAPDEAIVKALGIANAAI